MEMNFCRRCGTQLTLVRGHVYTCKNEHILFANASPAACLLIVNDKNEMLVAIRAHNPGKGMLDAPGGFNDGAETLENGLFRELEEEVGLKPSNYTSPQYLLSGLDRYEYKGEIIDVLCGVFYAYIIDNPTINPQDDVAEAHFMPIENIDPNRIFSTSIRQGFLKLKQSL